MLQDWEEIFKSDLVHKASNCPAASQRRIGFSQCSGLLLLFLVLFLLLHLLLLL